MVDTIDSQPADMLGYDFNTGGIVTGVSYLNRRTDEDK